MIHWFKKSYISPWINLISDSSGNYSMLPESLHFSMNQFDWWFLTKWFNALRSPAFHCESTWFWSLKKWFNAWRDFTVHHEFIRFWFFTKWFSIMRNLIFLKWFTDSRHFTYHYESTWFWFFRKLFSVLRIPTFLHEWINLILIRQEMIQCFEK